MAPEAQRCGVVALLGRPNAGKSTLLNRLVGERLAIVTAKPQTTRSRILGIVTRPGAQLLLVDTPGAHDSPKALNRALLATLDEVVEDCDVALLLVDPVQGVGEAEAALRKRVEERGRPVLVVATKSDLLGGREAPLASRPAAQESWAPDLCISARTGEGMDALLAALVERLPEGPPLYAPDALTDRPLRFLAAELVREAVFEELSEELPYETAVEIEAFDEASRPDAVLIRATLLVERRSQKGMVIGRGGQRIRAIGTRARQGLERLLGRHVRLELWVKVEPGWHKRPKRLKSLGYY